MARVFGSVCADLWIRSFFRHLRGELREVVSDFRGLRKRSRQQAARFVDDDITPAPGDERERVMMACCSMVLATYREVQTHVSDADALRHVQVAGSRVYRNPTRAMVRVLLAVARSPLKQLSKQRFRKYNQWMFGPAMEFDQHDSDQSVELVVRRCAFHQFFVKHGEPDLTRTFCGWDRNWMDVIDRASSTLRSERPVTISTGGECCRFRIACGSACESKHANDIILQNAKCSRSPGKPATDLDAPHRAP